MRSGGEGCISVLVGARGVRGWILYLYGNVWGGVGRVIVLCICMGDVWRRVGGVVNRGGACVLRSGGYLVPGRR